MTLGKQKQKRSIWKGQWRGLGRRLSQVSWGGSNCSFPSFIQWLRPYEQDLEAGKQNRISTMNQAPYHHFPLCGPCLLCAVPTVTQWTASCAHLSGCACPVFLFPLRMLYFYWLKKGQEQITRKQSLWSFNFKILLRISNVWIFQCIFFFPKTGSSFECSSWVIAIILNDYNWKKANINANFPEDILKRNWGNVDTHLSFLESPWIPVGKENECHQSSWPEHRVMFVIWGVYCIAF